ncbi:MAG: protein kinase [Verrucomicrobia bacterium]|nr:protein kinase [Verrucomicrobiota bacterium]
MNLQMALDHRSQVEEFRRKHRTWLVTLLFTDIVGSTQIKQALGDRQGVALIQQHHALVREILRQFKEGAEISTAGDSFFIVFVKPSDAVWFSLLVQARLRALAKQIAHGLHDRIGIHIGEVVIEEREGMARPKDLYGAQVDICARVMSLAGADQILLTRSAFDNARQVLKGEELKGLNELQWLNHGPYAVKGWEEPVEICEVGESGAAVLKAPGDSEKAHRLVSGEQELVLGWRPALEQAVPGTKWVLENKLGEGGFGEVWVGRHQTIKEQRVFKFCFRADRVRTLKREVTLFRVLKERIGEHPNIVRLLEVYFDEPPYYIEMDYVEGRDLKTWSEERGGVERIPLEVRLEIVAQVADALQAAHEAGVIHRDVKPGNILVSGSSGVMESWSHGPRIESTLQNSNTPALRALRAKLTDFGIGQVMGEEYLAGITRAGFTQTMLGSTSSSGAGTQMYLAPEIVAGKPASTRSDIYSLGVVLYQLLVGDFSRPVTTDWAEEISDPLLREDLKHCFAGNPDERFVGVGQLATSLRSLDRRQKTLAEQQAAIATRERAAYRRGVIRTAAYASAVVIVIASLAFYAANEAHRAGKGELAARQNLYAADMLLSQQALEANNWGRAVELLEKHRPEPGQKDLRGWEWRHLWERCRSDAFFTLGPHSRSVKKVAFSTDGKILIAADFGGFIKVWNVADGKEIGSFQDEGMIFSMALSPDGSLLASAGEDGTVRFREVRTRKELAPIKREGWITSVEFSPDSKTLAVYANDQTVTLWNVETKRQTASFTVSQGRSGYTGITTFSPDGKRLAIGEKNGQIRVLDLATKTEKLNFLVAIGGVQALAFSPDGKTLAIAAGSRSPTSIKICDAETGQELANLVGHTSWIVSLAFSPDGKALATASADQTVKLWQVATRQETATLRGHRDEVWAVAFSPDSRTLASGSKDGEIKFWKSTPRPKDVTGAKLGTGILKGAISSDGTSLVTINTNWAISLWSTTTLREVTPELLDASNTASVAVGPGGKLVALGTRDGFVRLWEKGVTRILGVFDERADQVTGVKFSADGKYLAAGDNAQLTVWDLVKTQRVASFKLPTRDVRKMAYSRDTPTVAFSADKGILAAGFANGWARVWDLRTQREIASFAAHNDLVAGVAVSADGRKLVTVGYDARARLWDVGAKKEMAKLPRTLNAFSDVAFSQDGSRLAMTASEYEGSIKIVDIETGLEVATVKSLGGVSSAKFLPDGDGLAAFGGNSLFVWRAPSFAEIDAVEKARTNSAAPLQK